MTPSIPIKQRLMNDHRLLRKDMSEKSYSEELLLPKKGTLSLEARFLTAAITSNLQEVVACLEAGVNVNAYIRGGCNALHLAAERGNIPLALALSASPDLDYNAKSDVGFTPLMLACFIRKRIFVIFLLRHNADPNATDRFGRTALHHVCRIDAVELAYELLRNRDTDINRSDCYGATPLLVALLEAKSLRMAGLLLRRGASFDVGPQRSLPLFLECANNCTRREDLETIRFLVKAGADVNVTDEITRKTALHIVAITGFVPLVTQLIALGAIATKVDVSGRLPSDVALMHGNYKVYKVLTKEEAKAKKKEEQKAAEEDQGAGTSHS